MIKHNSNLETIFILLISWIIVILITFTLHVNFVDAANEKTRPNYDQRYLDVPDRLDNKGVPVIAKTQPNNIAVPNACHWDTSHAVGGLAKTQVNWDNFDFPDNWFDPRV